MNIIIAMIGFLVVGFILGDIIAKALVCKQFNIKMDGDTSWIKIFNYINGEHK